MVPPPFVVATNVKFVFAPFGIVPMLHATTPAGALFVGIDDETNFNPAGSTFDTTTPLAVAGPRFVTPTVYVALCPSQTGFGETVTPTVRSAWISFTTVGSTTVLLSGFCSASFATTETVFVIVPELPGFTVSETLVTAKLVPLPSAMLPRLNVTVPPPAV